MQTIDVYAHTNPAFGALVLYNFTTGFTAHPFQIQDQGNRPVFPHFFLALPILYSKKGRKSFEGTNQSTGFLNWLERCPQIRINFDAEVVAGSTVCEKSLLFAVSHQLLNTDGWYYWPVDNPPWRKPKWKVTTDERGRMLSNARSLGAWMARLHLPDIFLALGIRP